MSNHTEQDLIAEWTEFICEGQTRTFCRPEHFSGYDTRMKRLRDRCLANGYDPTTIGRAAMQKVADSRK